MNYSMIILTDSAIRDILSSYFTSVKSSPMDNNQTPQTPECVNEDRRAFLGTLAAGVVASTTGLATSVLADEVSESADYPNVADGASDDAQGSGIDDAQETLTIEDLEAQIAEIQEKIEELEADADNLTEERWIELDELYQRLAELENQKQALGQQILAEEKSETAQQEAVIEEERAETAQNEVAIETKTEIVENLDEINDTLGNN